MTSWKTGSPLKNYSGGLDSAAQSIDEIARILEEHAKEQENKHTKFNKLINQERRNLKKKGK